MPRVHLTVAVLAVALAAAAFVFLPDNSTPEYVSAATPAPSPALLPLAANVLDAVSPYGLTEPVAQFKERITMKTFGEYITPDTSPVANDRFTGFHTGVDAEFTDALTADVPVVAIADGTVTLARWVNGYGGVVVVKHRIAGNDVSALYGHLDAASLAPAGSRVTAGQRLGVLGDDHSQETDGVRKHLHFALYAGPAMDYRGYVPAEDALAGWLDPLRFF